MDGEQAQAPDGAHAEGKRQRQRSTIGFPYMDLNSAIELANVIHAHVGSGICDDNQLAAWSGQSAKSSTFRVQIYAARMFGVIEGESSQHRLTALGGAILDPDQTRQARVNAFLAVPLYKAIFEAHKTGVLPPAAALEREMVALGVSDKQKDRARQVFERSAEQAGFFEQGKNRLVMPGVATQSEKPEKPPKGNNGNGGNGGGDRPPRHPLIEGLFQSLPPQGDPWSTDELVDWLQAAAYNLRMVYKLKGHIKVSSPPRTEQEKDDA